MIVEQFPLKFFMKFNVHVKAISTQSYNDILKPGTLILQTE